MEKLLAFVIIGITYLGLAFGHLSFFGMSRTGIKTELAGKEGYRTGFWEHLKIGLPLTILSLLILYSCLI